jgi:uncharacterized protein (DUF1778 family)
MGGRRKFDTLRATMTPDQRQVVARKVAAMADEATNYTLDVAESAALAEALAKPAKANDALRELMRGKAPWE